MSWLAKIFPVQSRESEIEESVQNCVNEIINNGNEFNVSEQVYIANKVKGRLEEIISREAVEIAEELEDYRRALGLL